MFGVEEDRSSSKREKQRLKMKRYREMYPDKARAIAKRSRERNAEAIKARRASPEFKAKQRQYCKSHPETIKAAQKRYRERHKEKIRGYHKARVDLDAAYFRANHLKRTFGISEAEYNEMLKRQNDVCAICGEAEMVRQKSRSGKIRLAVDHDHSTGNVRGLLCRRCNSGVAFLDKPGWLIAASRYLQRAAEAELNERSEAAA